jgi:hypothetical protein
MPEISDFVGAPPSANLPHDVALVQAMLKVTPNRKGHPYFTDKYNGVCGRTTIEAIEAFQLDQGTATPPNRAALTRSLGALYTLRAPVQTGLMGAPRLTRLIANGPSSIPETMMKLGTPSLTVRDTFGVLRSGWPTMRTLSDKLPGAYAGMRTARGAHLVYWAGSAQAAADSAALIAADTGMDETFRNTVAEVVRKMFDQYELVVAPAPGSNALRSFQKQYEIRRDTPGATEAGPGESNHNYGQAIDIGFVSLKWMKPTGEIETEGAGVLDMKKLSHVNDRWRNEMWALRAEIAYNQLGLFPTKKRNDQEHIQAYDDHHVHTRTSLATLLTLVGEMNWEAVGDRNYKCDLGFNAMHNVGEAMQIWAKNGPMQKSWIAAGRHVAAAQVTDAQVNAMRDALKADFQAAERKRDQWVPIP